MNLGKSFYYSMLLTVVILFVGVWGVSASDELFLNGVVKGIDYKTKTVTVTVASESCLGTRSFRIADPSILDGTIGKEIRFQIDRSTCKGKEKPRIVSIEGKKL